MKTIYHTPRVMVYDLYQDMLRQPHLLIAGATGSGKSVLLNGLIYTALVDSPARVEFILIDPKGVELSGYRKLPHTVQYAAEPDEWIAALENAARISEERYRIMKKRHLKTWDGPRLYVVIDELAYLMTMRKKQALPLLQGLGMRARASGVSLLACTQTVKADVLSTTLTCNFDARVALRTSNAQQSRMIVDCAGCESFPSPTISHKAMCYYRTGADLTLWNVPMVPETDLANMIRYWQSPKCKTRRLF